MQYSKAVTAAEVMSSAPTATEESKAEYAAALSSHPGRSGNGQVTRASSNGNGNGKADGNGEVAKVGRVWEVKIGGSGLTTTEVLTKIAAKEVTPEEGAKLLAVGKDEITVYCSESSGWVCIDTGFGRSAALHPQRWEAILPHAEEILSALAVNAEKTAATLAAAKANKGK
jgi:hypothetical protein